MRRLLLILIALFTFTRTSVLAESPNESFLLKDGQTIVFIGDSITYGELYVRYIDAYLFTRFPDKRFHVISRGIPSETVAGTSEEIHDPPRPDVHTRFATTVPPLKPDVVFFCYGMNDGIYQSPNEPVFAKYRAGVKRLVDRIQEEANALPVVLSPTTFEFRPFAKRKPRPGPNSYLSPAADYDDTLAQFAKWLTTQRKVGLTVIDQHTPMRKHLAQRLKDDRQFTLANDGIHPNPTGHWLMAQSILTGIGAPAIVAEAHVDLSNQKSSPEVSQVKDLVNGVQFVWKSPLPMGVDPRWDVKSLSLAHSNKRLNRYRLTVAGLAHKNFDLLVDGEKVAIVSGDDLSTGLDLAKFANFPTHKRSAEVLQLVLSRRKILQDVWIKGERHPRMVSIRRQRLKSSQATPEQAAALEKQIRELSQPVPLKIELLSKE